MAKWEEMGLASEWSVGVPHFIAPGTSGAFFCLVFFFFVCVCVFFGLFSATYRVELCELNFASCKCGASKLAVFLLVFFVKGEP